MTSRSCFALWLSLAALAVASGGACSSQVHDASSGGSGGAGGASPLCPSSPPASGEPCTDDALACKYGGDGCGNLATCTNGAWVVTDGDHCCHDCGEMNVCPALPPTEGTGCSGPPSGCVYMVNDACGNVVTEDFDCDGGVWQKLDPGGPSDCSATQACAIRGVDDCAEDGKCAWLVPGCATDQPPEPLPSAGCFPTSDCLTTPTICGAGELCESVVINPCFGKKCDACGATWGICLFED